MEYKHADVPDDSLLFFVPTVSCNDIGGDAKLKIRIPYLVNSNSDRVRYTDVVYDILVEEDDATMRKAIKGDIVAYKMCIFRFQKSANRAILCNSPQRNDVSYSSLKATNALFINPPKMIDPENNLQYELVSKKEFNALVEKVNKMDEKIFAGTLDPEVALEGKPAGTIYIQYKKD